MSDTTYTHPDSSADKTIAGLRRIDDKVDALRARMLNDPDSLGDKLLKMAIPAVAGLVQLLWDKGTGRSRNDAEVQQGLLMSVAFAAASAAFGAVVSTLSGRGSQALVDRRHRKRP